MRNAVWRGVPGRALAVGAGAWALGWILQAWRDTDVLFAIVNGIYGCG